MLPAGDAEGADGLGLVHLAVAHEAPDPARAGVDEAVFSQRRPMTDRARRLA
jgi:hypothetical protein